MSMSAFFQRTKHIYLPLILTYVIANIFTSDLQAARWTRQPIQYGLIVTLAIIFGAASAAARFRASTVFVYHGLMSFAVASESVSNFIPKRTLANAATQMSVLQLMNIRLINLTERISGWIQSILQRQPIFDEGWLHFCIVFLIWNGWAWYMWHLIRKQNAIVGLIPMGLMLGINIHLRSGNNTPLVTFIMLGCLLVLCISFHRTKSNWQKREVDHPDLGYDWSVNSILLTCMVTIFAFIFPLLSTKQGWQAVSDFLERLQIEPRTIASSRSGDAGNNGASQVSALTPDIGTIGTPLELGKNTIMLVRISDPAPPPLESGVQTHFIRKHYWRSEVYGEYTGSGWLPIETESTSETPASIEAEIPEGRYLLEQTYEILVPHGERLFAVNRPVSADATIKIVPTGPEDSLITGVVAKYSVTSYAEATSAYDLSAAPTNYPDEIAATYLQLPDSIPPRVRNLADRISLGTETPYEIVKRIETYLRENYTYDLDIPPVPGGKDAVDYFLFEAPGGFCSYYASAMVVMLRSQGIPARVVTGYAMGEYDYRVSAYRVRVDDSHAWVEVYFSGFGWIEFEPTPPRTVFVRNPQEFGRELESEGEETQEPTIVIPRVLLVNGLRVILGLMGIGVGFIIYKRLNLTPTTPGEKIQRLYTNMRRSLRTFGCVAPASTTPNEFLTRFTPALSGQPHLRNALTQCTALYLKARFSDLDISETAAGQIQILWSHARIQRLTLRIQHFWRKYVVAHLRRSSDRNSPHGA